MMPKSKQLAWLTEKLECQSDIFDGSVTGFNYKGQKYSFKRHNRIIYYVPRTEVLATHKSGACLYYCLPYFLK